MIYLQAWNFRVEPWPEVEQDNVAYGAKIWMLHEGNFQHETE